MSVGRLRKADAHARAEVAPAIAAILDWRGTSEDAKLLAMRDLTYRLRTVSFECLESLAWLGPDDTNKTTLTLIRKCLDEDVVSVVFGLMRSGDHELRCCCVDLLVMLTDGCSETEAANILGGSGHERVLLRLLCARDSGEEVYREGVLALLRRLLGHPKSRAILLNSEALEVVERLAAERLLTPAEWAEGKKFVKALLCWRRVLEKFPGVAPAAAPSSSSSAAPAAAQGADAAPPPLPSRPTTVFDTQKPPVWEASVKTTKKMKVIEELHALPPQEVHVPTPRLTGLIYFSLRDVCGVALPAALDACPDAPQVFLKMVAVSADGREAEDVSTVPVDVTRDTGSGRWPSTSCVVPVPYSVLAVGATRFLSPAHRPVSPSRAAMGPQTFSVMCELWCQGVGPRPVLLGACVLDSRSFISEGSESVTTATPFDLLMHIPGTTVETGTVRVVVCSSEEAAALFVQSPAVSVKSGKSVRSPSTKASERRSPSPVRSPLPSPVKATPPPPPPLPAVAPSVVESLIEGVVIVRVGEATGVAAVRPGCACYVRACLTEGGRADVLSAARTDTITAKHLRAVEGLALEWRQGAEEALVLGYACGAGGTKTLLLELWEEDLRGKERLIARGEVDASALFGADVTEDSGVRVPLKDGGGKGAGILLVQLSAQTASSHAAALLAAADSDRGPTPEPEVSGTLLVVVLEGRKLKNMDLFSKQDPYVKVSLVDAKGTVMSTAQTGVIRKGGTDPKWTPEHRNSLSLSYRVPIGSRVTLYLEAWDEDIGFDDDLIGMGEVDVSDLVVPGAPTSRLLCALADAKREEDRGVIVLTAAPQGVAKPYRPMSKQLLFDGILHIRAVSGEQLADRDTFTKQDPYVKMTVYNSSKKVVASGRTVTVKGGGVDLYWPPQGSTVSVRYSLRGGAGLTLHAEAWDADVGLRDDLIGQAMIDLSEFVGHVVADATVVCELHENAVATKGAPSCGRLTLSLSAGVLAITDQTKKLTDAAIRKLLAHPEGEGREAEGDEPPAPTGPFKGILTVRVVEGRDLVSREAFGKQDPFVTLSLITQAACSQERVTQCTSRTGVVDKGGTNPVWVIDNVLPMRYEAAVGDRLILACSAWDYERMARDNDLIGSCELDVSWLINARVFRRNVTFPLSDPAKKSASGRPSPAGSIVCSVDAAVLDMTE